MESVAKREAAGIDTLPQKLLFTIKETAYMLSMSEKSVRRLIKERGLLKTNPALRKKLITKESIDRFTKL